MKTLSLIAMVATAVIVGGERRVIQPGEPLPDDTSEHDQRELLASGAAKSPHDEAALETQTAREKKKADADFQREREAVQAAQASITATPADAGSAATKSTTTAKKR